MTARAYIIAYDIRDEGRLRRVHYYLKKWALHVQYSVFLGNFTRNGVSRLTAGLCDLIDDAEDDVRVYPLPDRPEWTQLGEATLPEAVHLLGGAAGDALVAQRESRGGARASAQGRQG